MSDFLYSFLFFLVVILLTFLLFISSQHAEARGLFPMHYQHIRASRITITPIHVNLHIPHRR